MKCSLLLLSLLTSIVAIMSGCGHQERTTVFGAPDVVAQVGASYQKSGVLTESEYEHVAALENKVGGGGVLTEGEVDWLLSLTRRNGTERQKSLRMLVVTLAFGDGSKSSFPSSRFEDVFGFAAQDACFTGKPEAITSIGCYILGYLKDKRGLVYLRPLLQSNDINLQHSARRAILMLSKS